MIIDVFLELYGITKTCQLDTSWYIYCRQHGSEYGLTKFIWCIKSDVLSLFDFTSGNIDQYYSWTPPFDVHHE